jgi:hypothetical protein
MAALRATSRWAVSGTPIQNSLLDFLGLFKFLHFSPYNDSKVFDDDLVNIWRVRPAEEAAETFKKLLSCVMIRRTKAILDLPSHNNRLIRVPFSDEEKEHYRRIEQPVMDMLDRSNASGDQTNVTWMTAIQQINKLRLVCNLGVFVPLQSSCPAQAGIIDESTSVMNARFSMSAELCAQCLQPLEASTCDSGLRDIAQPQTFHSACSRFYCADCAALLEYQSPDPCACMEQAQPCQLRPLTSFLPTPRLTPVDNLSPSSMDWDRTTDISSKVWALVAQIRSCPQEKQ